MASALHLLVRLAHVLGMAALLGGVVVAWHTLAAGDRDPLPTLRRYELLFWGSIGVMIATGVGNLGALGPPGSGTRWGTILTVKLVIVTGVVVLSAVRSLAVGRLVAEYRRLRESSRTRSNGGERTDDRSVANAAMDPSVRARLSALYAATGWGLGLAVALAEVLAHG